MRKINENNTFFVKALLLIIAFILGGTGFAMLYNANEDFSFIVGGFALVGIGVAIVYKLIEDG